MFKWNPATNQFEDDNGPVAQVPLPPGALASGGQPIPPAALAMTPPDPAKVGPLAPPKPIVMDLGPADPAAPALPTPPEPPGAVPPPLPAPAGGKRVEGGTTSTTRTKIDPLEQKALEREQKSLEGDKGIATREGKLGEDQAQVDAAAATRQQSHDEGHAAAQSLLADHFKGLIADDEKKYNDAVAKRSSMAIQRFGEGDPAWMRIGRIVAIGLGEAGASLTKSGHNTARDIIDQSAQEHYLLQRHKLEEADRNVAQARQGIQDRKQSKIEAMADLERDSAAWNKALASQARSEAARIGTDHAKVEGEKIASDAEKRAAQHAEKIGALRRVQVEGRTTWTNTEGGDKASDPSGRAAGIQIQKATLAEHGQAALDTADKLHKKGVYLTEDDRKRMQDNMSDVRKMEQTGPLEAKALRSTIYARSKYEGLPPEKAELAQAYDILAQKAAGITSPSHDAHEMENSRSMFDLNAPGVGDVARVQTLQNLRGIIGAAKGLGGKFTGIAEQGAAAGRAAGTTTPEPGAPAPAGGGRRGKVNGRPAIIHDNGTYDYVQ